ncbi:glucose-1-phosphate thymidylyltransferase [Natronomonas sp. F2-12]|uniref:Glucose-1-phosphate thymidylyltransferase n=1 Tax=Natronomonas aquatica TaxID=2841590 RepID=A0A9R1D6J2_9EURY|nr:glucose-1-phosphate thymidylyltransferase [Natronomonas aquatica]MCQ4333142.1 glucose-1-phosphate thymidylyltransferase [Natronomonas aquatica]
MKGLILAGGTGSRLRPITHTGPKQLVPVANRPVIEYAIEDLKEAGVTEIGIVLGNLGREAIQEYLGDGSDYGLEITYIIQGNPLGLAHAAGCAEEFIDGENFVMYLGDNILEGGITELVESFQAGNHSAGIALQHVEDPQQFGVADVDTEGTVRALVEKPDDPPSDLALIGIYVFSPTIFDAIEALEPSWRGELEITDAIQSLLDDGHSIDSAVVEGWWKDTGKPEDVLDANRLVLEDTTGAVDGTVEDGTEITGNVDVAEGATLEAGAVIRGPVSIGEDVRITADTYLGPYTSIGDGSTIENAHIENTVVVGEATIRTNVKIVDSLIGEGATIDTAEDLLPEGKRLVIGENSQLKL